MAGKPKDSRRVAEKLKRRRKRMERKSEPGFSGREYFQLAPLGMEKMSDVLDDFVAPVLPEAAAAEELRALFGLGVAAWNTALLPEQQQEQAIDAVMREIGPGDAAALQLHRDLLNTLILRKKTRFATNRRKIVGFQLIDTGKHYHLNVMSTLDVPARA